MAGDRAAGKAESKGEAAAPKPKRSHKKKAPAVEAAEELTPEAQGPGAVEPAETEASEPEPDPDLAERLAELPPPHIPSRQEREWAEAEQEWSAEVESSYLQSKYTLVSVAAKRARQLLAGSKRRVETLSEKPVSIAMEELTAGKLIFERTREGIK